MGQASGAVISRWEKVSFLGKTLVNSHAALGNRGNIGEFWEEKVGGERAASETTERPSGKKVPG